MFPLQSYELFPKRPNNMAVFSSHRSHRLFWHAEIYMSHRNSQKSQKFSLRFLSAARAEGTFRDFLRPSGSKRAELERRDFCVTKNKVND